MSNINIVLTLLKKHQKNKSMLESFSTKYDVFQILISTILSARAKDTTTIPLCKKLFKIYPDWKTLSTAKTKDVEKLLKPIGFYKNKTKYIIETACATKGKVPETLEELLKLPGVGRKVANCVLVYGFGEKAIPVDTHVHRISNRLGWVKTKTPEQTEKALEKIVPKPLWMEINERLVIHGQTICFPRKPNCTMCPVRKYCQRKGL